VIVLDTSGLLAALDAGQRQHEPARQVLEDDSGPLLLSPFVLAELDYLLLGRVGAQAERALLDEVAAGAYDLVPFGPEGVAEAADLIGRHAELKIGLADGLSRGDRGRGQDDPAAHPGRAALPGPPPALG
jgi:predicted nucleic acid-binding protein